MKHRSLLRSAVAVALAAAYAAGQTPAPAPTPQPAPRPAPAADPNGPRIASPKATYDFGEAPQNDKLEYDFELMNTGKAPLDIIRINPTCQCTVADPEKKRLEPGEKTKVRATLNTQTFSGPVNKVLVVESNDPTQPRFNLQMVGRISPAFRATVGEVHFGALRKGTKFPEVEFDIVTPGGLKATLRDVQSDVPFVKARFAPLTEGPIKGYRVTCWIEGNPPVGELRGTYTFVTDLPSMQQFQVKFGAIIDGEVQMKPKSFNFGAIKKGDTTTAREIQITKTGAADLKIEGLELKPEGLFKAELVEVAAGREYKVRVTLLPGVEAKYQRGTLVVRTNVPGEDVLTAYFYAMVKE
ncbi:MAG TPA: DUF1573 domain-containing protein [Planctomycetota bacterium]|nr:DUF1573 domain-containing protein [Planctomycetota bacterium]